MIGLTHFDNLPMTEKVTAGAQEYKRRFGELPNRCVAHPQHVIEPVTVDGNVITVEAVRDIQHWRSGWIWLTRAEDGVDVQA